MTEPEPAHEVPLDFVLLQFARAEIERRYLLGMLKAQQADAAVPPAAEPEA